MTRSSFFLRSVCILIGLALPLIILEVIVRAGFFEPHPPRGDRPSWYYLPQRSGTDRDYRYDAVKPKNTFRIVVVGDSFTFGDYLQFDDTFSKRLERWLNLNDTETKVEVINYSKPGYSSADELPLVRNAVANLSPDLVLLQYTLNDPELKPYRANNKIVHGEIALDSPLFTTWRGLGFVMTRYYNWKSRHDFQQYYFDLFEKPETWNRCVHALTDMKAAADAKHVPFAAVIFPLFNTPLDNTYPYLPLHRKVSDEFAKLNVPALDLFDTFRDVPNDWLEVIPGENGHPNEIAHRMAAESIYSWLNNEHLVPQNLVARRGVKNRNIYNPYRINSDAQDSAGAADSAVADGGKKDVDTNNED